MVQIGSFLSGAAGYHATMSAIYHFSREWISMGRHIADTRTIGMDIYCVHLQSSRTLFVDTVRPAVCSGENLRTNIDR